MRVGGRRIPVIACAVALATAGIAAASPPAGREPVLKQVDLPHNYYWRELYLPQLTTGPSSASFLPDGNTLVYSMAGSLWRQRIGDDDAVELTHATGAYDYQPDVARDGRTVVFTRYDGKAMELWTLDLASGRARALTHGGLRPLAVVFSIGALVEGGIGTWGVTFLRSQLGLAVVAPALVHLTFYKLLRVPLPPGLLAFPWA